MVEALVLAPIPGLVARLLWPSSARGLLTTLVASLLGWLLGYAVFHELMGFHALHLFAPEGILPGTAGALVALTVIGRFRRRRERVSFRPR